MKRQLRAITGLERTSDAFKAKLIKMSDETGLDPSMLAACMAFETGGTFSPSMRNPSSQATGLIQFMPSTARKLGTTIDDLAKMTDIEQLDYVKAYFDYIMSWQGTQRLTTVTQHYLAIFAPAFTTKTGNHPLYSAPSKAYELNKPLDLNKDGIISADEAAHRVIKLYNEALNRPPFIVDVDSYPSHDDHPTDFPIYTLGLPLGIALGFASFSFFSNLLQAKYGKL